MKIYNKSNFFLGLFLSVLGLALFFVSIWKGFDLKGSVLMVLCLFFGIGVMIVCMLGHSVIGEVLAVPMTLAFGIMLAVMMLLELILAIYYDRKI